MTTALPHIRTATVSGLVPLTVRLPEQMASGDVTYIDRKPAGWTPSVGDMVVVELNGNRPTVTQVLVPAN